MGNPFGGQLRSEAAGGLGVALGGGTARGLAHIGALKALEAHGFSPRALAGTSFGAVLAALYALGTPTHELEHLVRQQNTLELWAQALDPGLHRASLVNGVRLRRWLDRKLFRGATFADLELPLAVAAADLATGELVVLREGSLAEAVMASSALPGILSPVRNADRVLVDGGFVEAVPFLTLAVLQPTQVIGLHAGVDVRRSRAVGALRRFGRSRFGRAWLAAAPRQVGFGPLGRLAAGIARTIDGYQRIQRVPDGALLVRIDPPIAWWDFHRSPEAIAAGETAVRAALSSDPVRSAG